MLRTRRRRQKHPRLHGDCHPSNVLWTDAGPHFVDFDDSRMAPAIQDLWLLLPGDRPEASRALGDLLAGLTIVCVVSCCIGRCALPAPAA